MNFEQVKKKMEDLHGRLCAAVGRGEWLWHGMADQYETGWSGTGDYDKSMKHGYRGRAEACRETAVEMDALGPPPTPDELPNFVKTLQTLLESCPHPPETKNSIESLMAEIDALCSSLPDCGISPDMGFMKIRPFEASDGEQVVALWKLCGLVVSSNNPLADITRKLAVGRDLFLVGEIRGNIVASAMGGYEGHRGWINYLAVHPDYRRRGLGGRIIAAVEERLRSLGCPKINLQVRETNLEAIGFYESAGFSRDRVISLGKRLIDDEPEDI